MSSWVRIKNYFIVKSEVSMIYARFNYDGARDHSIILMLKCGEKIYIDTVEDNQVDEILEKYRQMVLL